MIVYGGAWNPDYQDEVIYADSWSLELSGAPRWVPLTPLGTSPVKRKGASAVYDPSGDRMLVFGGWTKVPLPPPWSGMTGKVENETWALSLAGTPEWRLIPVTTAPPGRQETVAVVDPQRQQLVISGGNSWQWSHTMNDTWTLPLDAGLTGAPATWIRLPTPASSPAVDQHAAMYSPERDKLIQYGGEGAGNLCFELDLQSAIWSQVDSDVSGPFPSRRVQPTLITDPALPSMRLFGGGWGCQHDLWEISLDGPAVWSKLPTSGIAPACGDPNFVVDRVHRRLLCITGGSVRGRGTLDQVWALPFDEPRVWARLETRGTNPPPRFEYGLAYDSHRQRVLLFGGGTWQNPAENQADDRDDLWQLSLDDLTWTQLAPVNSPGVRRHPSVHYDPAGDRLIVAGGATSTYRGWLSRFDCWALALGEDSLRWSHFAPDLPMTVLPYEGPRQQTALDPLRSRLIFWDGARKAWTLALDHADEWRPLELSGELPASRNYFGLVYDDRGDEMIVFGGFDGSQKADLQALRFSDEVRVVVRGLGEDGGTLPRRGMLEAAILGSSTFSVDSVLAETVTLGGARPFASPPQSARRDYRDVNGDRLADLILKFRAESLQVAPRDTLLRLWGRTPHFAVRGLAKVEKPRFGRRAALRTGVSLPEGQLSLTLVNPSLSVLLVRFSLESASPARMSVYDIAGRKVEDQDLRGFGPGEHAIEIGRGHLRPGLYLIRLRQGERQVVARGLLIR